MRPSASDVSLGGPEHPAPACCARERRIGRQRSALIKLAQEERARAPPYSLSPGSAGYSTCLAIAQFLLNSPRPRRLPLPRRPLLR